MVRQGQKLRIVTMKTTSVAGLLFLAIALAGCQTDGVQYPGYTSMMPYQGYMTQARHVKAAKHHWAKAAKHHPKTAKHATHHHRVKAAKRVKPAKAATTNPAALGFARMDEPQRMAAFRERLRGLCEIVKAEKIRADSWRASCAKGDAFTIKIYPDGFMTVTRS
jgi:uncharacterized iron-regulated membrane protein